MRLSTSISASGSAAVLLLASGLLSPLAAQLSVRELAVSGAAAPGSGGRQFSGFRSVRVDRLGRAAFRAELTGAGGEGGGIWLVDRAGSSTAVAVAGRTVTPFRFFNGLVEDAVYDEVGDPVLSEDGQVAYWTAFRENGGTITPDRQEAVMVTGATPGVSLLAAWESIQARTEPGPGGTQIGGMFFNESFAQPLISGDRTVTVRTHLKPSAVAGVDEPRDGIFFVSLGSSGEAPGTTMQPFFAAIDHALAPGLGGGHRFVAFRESTPAGPDGSCAFIASAAKTDGSDEVDGVWRRSGSNMESLALGGRVSGGRLADHVYRRFSGLDRNSGGTIAFWAALTSEGGAAGDRADREGVFRTSGASIVPVVATGDPAPGATAATFVSLGNPNLAADGSIVLRAVVKTTTGGTLQGIWLFPTTGQPKAVALTGIPAPGAGGGRVFSSLGGPLINAPGQVAFAGVSRRPGGGDPDERGGIWALNRGSLEGVAIEGTQISASGKRIASAALGDLGDGGEVGMILSYEDGSQAVAVATLADEEPPTTPQALTVTLANSFSISFQWSASSDNVGVESYHVYRDGFLVGEVDAPSTGFDDHGLLAGTVHRYRVDAVDLNGNVSAKSGELVVEVPRQGAPVVVDNSDAGYSEIRGTWYNVSGGGGYGDGWRRASATLSSESRWVAALPVAGTYEVYAWWGQSSSLNANVAYSIAHDDGESTVVVDQGRDGGRWNYLGTYRYHDLQSGDVRVGLPTPGGADVCADAVSFVLVFNDRGSPSEPPGLEADWIDTRTATLHWEPSDDDVGVERYAILRDGVEVGQSTGLDFIDHGLEEGGVHRYQVQAIDYGGNRSQPGSPVILEMPSRGSEAIVDNGGAGYAELRGTWYTVSTGGYGGTWRRASATNASEARWTAPLPLPGIYEIYASWGESGSLSESAEFVVDHADGTTAVLRDQSTGGGSWNYLGAFRFSDGMQGSVRLVKVPPGGRDLSADAVRFVHIANDRFAPAVPPRLDARWVSPRAVELEWDPAWDDIGVLAYVVSRDGADIATIPFPGGDFVDHAVAPGSFHRYSVRALDHFGRQSVGTVESEVNVPNAGEAITVDDADAGFTIESGTWPVLSSGTCHEGGARLTDTIGSARFTPGYLSPGFYEVLAFHCSGEQLDAQADYRVTHADGSAAIVVDQNVSKGQWISLGCFRFGGDAGENVRIIADGSDWRRTCADAVRWVPLVTAPRLARARVIGVSGNRVTVEGTGRDTFFAAAGGVSGVRVDAGGTSVAAESVEVLSNERFRATFRLADPSLPTVWDLSVASAVDGALTSEGAMTSGDWMGDGDGDGVPAIFEFAFGGGMGTMDGERLPRIMDGTDGSRLVVYRQRRTKDGAADPAGGETGANRIVDGLVYSVELSTDLKTWLGGGGFLEPVGEPIDQGDGTELVTLRIDPALLRLSDGIFTRVQVSFADR